MADSISSLSSKSILKAILAVIVIIGLNLGCYRAFSGEDGRQEGTVCFALDCSVSMAGESLDKAKEELSRIAAHLPEDIRVSFVSFRREAEIAVPLTNDRSAVIDAAEALRAAGKTGISEGLRVAIGSLHGEIGKKMILLFTDGRNGEEHIDLSLRKELEKNGICLFVWEKEGNVNEELKEAAEKSGGAYGISADGFIKKDYFGAPKWKGIFFLVMALSECLGVTLFFVLMSPKKKKQGKRPLPNAGYLKKEDIRKML